MKLAGQIIRRTAYRVGYGSRMCSCLLNKSVAVTTGANTYIKQALVGVILQVTTDYLLSRQTEAKCYGHVRASSKFFVDYIREHWASCHISRTDDLSLLKPAKRALSFHLCEIKLFPASWARFRPLQIVPLLAYLTKFWTLVGIY